MTDDLLALFAAGTGVCIVGSLGLAAYCQARAETFRQSFRETFKELSRANQRVISLEAERAEYTMAEEVRRYKLKQLAHKGHQTQSARAKAKRDAARAQTLCANLVMPSREEVVADVKAKRRPQASREGSAL